MRISEKDGEAAGAHDEGPPHVWLERWPERDSQSTGNNDLTPSSGHARQRDSVGIGRAVDGA